MPESQTAPTSAVPGSPPSGKHLWKEYTHQDGRKYYYNSLTKDTVWQKPNELKTAKELELEESPWKEYKTPEGKKYYHNSSTSTTVWTAPEEYQALLDQLEEEQKQLAAVAAASAASASPSQPSTSPTTLMKPPMPLSASAVSTPSPLRHQTNMNGLQTTAAIGSPVAPHPDMARHSGPGAAPFLAPLHNGPIGGVRPPYPSQQGVQRPPQRFQQSFGGPPPSRNLTLINSNSNANSNNNSTNNSVSDTPDFDTKEEAEEAFKNLLKETGVTSTWTWEQTMRAVVTNPMYRALKTTAERKHAFQEYVDTRRVQEKQEERARQQKLKEELVQLFEARSDKVTHASRYTTISRLFKEEPAFKALDGDDRMRKSIFDHHVEQLVRKEKEEARQRRKSGMAALLTLFQSMPEITLTTRWSSIKESLPENKAFQENENLKSLNKIDQLSVFEDHMVHLETEYEQKRARERILRKRTERKRREGMKQLLQELRQSGGKLNARTTWMEIHPFVRDHPRYLEMLGQPGSTPMELFWDLVEDLDERLYQDRKLVQDVMKNIDYEIQPETSFEDFSSVISKQEKTSRISNEDLTLIFDQLLRKAIHYAKEEKRRQEKLTRKKAESFRFMLKTLDPPITVDSKWEDVKSSAEKTPEFVALENEDMRKEIFDRFVERLKERATKNYDSEDEDGSILEDDVDLKRSDSATALDRKHNSHSARTETATTATTTLDAPTVATNNSS
ncbi:hypothetical protein BGZ83_009962 [Gryganskiella cystojenkinii]|nr:hypothetical protein BGZ83_009962 [Gryganskiella cystojenkinii]